jgi:hypothetical protein
MLLLMTTQLQRWSDQDLTSGKRFNRRRLGFRSYSDELEDATGDWAGDEIEVNGNDDMANAFRTVVEHVADKVDELLLAMSPLRIARRCIDAPLLIRRLLSEIGELITGLGEGIPVVPSRENREHPTSEGYDECPQNPQGHHH